MQILFEPKYNIGDVVLLKINSEKEMVISSHNITQINEAGEVITHSYNMYDEEGATFTGFTDIDLEIVKSVHE